MFLKTLAKVHWRGTITVLKGEVMNSALLEQIKTFLQSIGAPESELQSLDPNTLEEFLASKFSTSKLMNKENEQQTLLAKVVSHKLGEMFKGDFIPNLDEVKLTNKPCGQYDVFLWCDESFIVGSESGHVEVYHFNGELANNNFKYGFEGQGHFPIGKVTEAFFKRIREEYLA
ncbi:hypothetical protein [Vibrio sp. D431a]|uniref:hypothetical protein n=1 Tax=Vibrio sp. D431a TaxID=2837388 RepID=UPI002552D9C2|nr:hypothetical protein [Vibrio sp. D431a]MDK9789904.1 hypothetical protein [Vibrio sp. D431a]